MKLGFIQVGVVEMLDIISTIRNQFDAQPTFGMRMDEAFRQISLLGFDGLIYDFTPVALGETGEVQDAALLELRNVDEGMRDLWFTRRYFRIDPVQRVAVTTTVPFCWSYDEAVDSVIRPLLTEEAQPVTDFLREHGVFSGVTVPIHMPGGGFATVSGIGLSRKTLWDDGETIARLGLLAQIFHASAAQYLSYPATPAQPGLRLTPREAQCLKLTAEGLSAKHICRVIERAEPTVIMHINSAMRKLGARNRVHAVTLATRQGLF